jgi:23S rRNA pseudouridine955/2504/2580 synthase
VGSSLRIVHRLDQETSGLLMLARSKESAAALSEGLKEGLIKKEYIGLSLFPPIASSTSSSIRTISSGGGGGGGNSGINKGFSIQEGICKHPIERTQWRQGTPGVVDSVEQWSAETVFKATTSLSSGFTIWRLSPLTGRRHQLRQHVLHLTNRMGGLLGDPKYYGKSKALLNSSSSPSSSTSSSLSSPGLMLHAFQLTIPAFTLGRHQVRDLIVKEELPSRIQAQLRLYSIPSRVISAALE